MLEEISMLTEERQSRNDLAVKIVMDKYSDVVRKLKNICKKYNINMTTGNSPRVLDFSLGKFYMGNVYDYDRADSDKIWQFIADILGIPRSTLFDRVIDAMND